MEKSLEDRIKTLSEAIFEKIQTYRRTIHQHPELSFEEVKTAAYVRSVLESIGITSIKTVAKTGVVAMIYGDHHAETDECIALRADLDALPIQEQSANEFPSLIAGVMHACGHDVHTSVLLGAAEIIYTLRNELPQPVKLIFQPGEERNPGGASLMIAEDVLKFPTVKEIYGLHVFPEMEVGKLGFRSGLYMASCDEIYITINGKGGHGAMPHQCIDPIVIGSNLILSLQQIVSRNCDPTIPCVLSFGYFAGLGATNVIPSQVELKGTFRTMDENWRLKAHELITKETTELVNALGAQVVVNIDKGYPFLVNDPSVTDKVKAKAISLLGKENIEELAIRMTAEDFAFYSQQIPSTFYRLGVGNKSKSITYPVHHPQFDVDESALSIGASMMAYSVF